MKHEQHKARVHLVNNLIHTLFLPYHRQADIITLT